MAAILSVLTKVRIDEAGAASASHVVRQLVTSWSAPHRLLEPPKRRIKKTPRFYPLRCD
jgi:hypothetical protein